MSAIFENMEIFYQFTAVLRVKKQGCSNFAAKQC